MSVCLLSCLPGRPKIIIIIIIIIIKNVSKVIGALEHYIRLNRK